MNMDGDMVDIREFLRESISKNELEVKKYMLEEKVSRINDLSNNNGLPPLFKKKKFSNYNAKYNTAAFNQAKRFVENFPNEKGMLLIGDVGVGKTHIAAGIANELNVKLYSSYFGNVVDIMGFVKSTYSKNSLLTELDAIKIITEKIDLLIIDDLGKENNTEHNLTLLYQIINKLYENEKPLVITTNYTSSELNRRLGDRSKAIISRICAMCEPVSLSGKDWRIYNEK